MKYMFTVTKPCPRRTAAPVPAPLTGVACAPVRNMLSAALLCAGVAFAQAAPRMEPRPVLAHSPMLPLPLRGPTTLESSLNHSGSLDAMREETRNMIEAVDVDEPTDLDVAGSLGQSLNRRLSHVQIQSGPPGIGKGLSGPAKARTHNEVELIQAANLPSVQAPQKFPGRWQRKAMPELENRGLSGAMFFSPDYSRQKTTLATLAGSAAVSLPDINDLQSDVKQVRSSRLPLHAEVSTNDLARIVEAGLGYSPVLEQVQAQLDVATSRTGQARSELFPRFSGRIARGKETSVTDSKTDKHTTSTQTLRLTQALLNLPAWADWMAARKTENAQKWRLNAGQETVSMALTKATVDLAVARLNMEFADEQLQQLTELLGYIQQRALAGASSQSELERARARVLSATQLRLEQQANYRTSLLEMERLTGKKYTSLQLPFLNQLPGLPSTLADLRKLMQDYSYDLLALRAEVDASSAQTVSAYGRLLPVVGVSYERDSGKNVRGTNPQTNDKRLLLVATWDVALGGKDVYAGYGAQSELANRKAKLTEELERTLTATDADFAMLQSTTLRISAGMAEQQATQKVLQAMREQLTNGRLSSILEALDAVERHYIARQRLVTTLSQQMTAHAQLLRRLGKLSEVRDPTLASKAAAARSRLAALQSKTSSSDLLVSAAADDAQLQAGFAVAPAAAPQAGASVQNTEPAAQAATSNSGDGALASAAPPSPPLPEMQGLPPDVTAPGPAAVDAPTAPKAAAGASQ